MEKTSFAKKFQVPFYSRKLNKLLVLKQFIKKLITKGWHFQEVPNQIKKSLEIKNGNI